MIFLLFVLILFHVLLRRSKAIAIKWLVSSEVGQRKPHVSNGKSGAPPVD